jgi:hypothetical protein
MVYHGHLVRVLVDGEHVYRLSPKMYPPPTNDSPERDSAAPTRE